MENEIPTSRIGVFTKEINFISLSQNDFRAICIDCFTVGRIRGVEFGDGGGFVFDCYECGNSETGFSLDQVPSSILAMAKELQIDY